MSTQNSIACVDCGLTAVTHGATAFITNNKTLRCLDAMLSILVLDSFVGH